MTRNFWVVLVALPVASGLGCGSAASRSGEDQSGGGQDGGGHVDGGSGCDPLAPPAGRVISVDGSNVGEIGALLASASPGDTFSFADGTYSLSGLWITTPGVTLRSASGDREAVVFDGEYDMTEVITVAASDVTVADLTIRRAGTHAIHVVTSGGGDTLRTRIHDVHVVDPRQQAIKINPSGDGGYVDDGIVSCSLLELTAAGRPQVDNENADGCYTGGVDAHQARDWVVRDNRIQGFWCPSGLSEHAVHFWRGSRGTVVERNDLRDNARGIGFGLSSSGEGRQYADSPCPEAGGAYVGHYEGIVRNNFVFASDPGLFGSEAGFDCGICLWSACGARVVHNSVASTQAHFSSIEWRFAGSRSLEIANNLCTGPLMERDGASASLAGNVEAASLELFADGARGDLHLAATAAAAIDQGVALSGGVCPADIDGEARDDRPDVGADERR